MMDLTMAQRSPFSNSDSYLHVDREDFSRKAESLFFIGQLMKDVAAMLQYDRLPLDDELFLAIKEMNVEAIEVAEQLLDVFNSVYLDEQVKSAIDMSGLRLWIHGFAQFNESFSQEQRIVSLKSIVNKMAKSQQVKLSSFVPRQSNKLN
jgi:hypothetical protein